MDEPRRLVVRERRERDRRARSPFLRPSRGDARGARAGPCRRRGAEPRPPSRRGSRRSRAGRRRPSGDPRRPARAARAPRALRGSAARRRRPPPAPFASQVRARRRSRPAAAGASRPSAPHPGLRADPRIAARSFAAGLARPSRSRGFPPAPSPSRPSAQNAIPSPYGSDRPCRHVISSRSASTIRKSSRTSRLLPIPGTPTSVTSCGLRSFRARASAAGERVELVLPSDERRGGAVLDVHAVAAHAARATSQDRDRLGLALRLDRLGVFELDRALGGAVGRLVDEDAVGGGGGLQAGGGVDDVAGGHALARLRARVQRDERLARR